MDNYRLFQVIAGRLLTVTVIIIANVTGIAAV